MKKVITYGTYDLFHYGHRRLLERAKALGDYLIVGVTSDDFDRARGKINVQQSLMERLENVKQSGLADEVIVEEYEGQKIDDIRRMNVDIFAIGSDWSGKFDYLKQYCQVIYLKRTKGISSTKIRSAESSLRIGLIGDTTLQEFKKYVDECNVVNGVEVIGIYMDGDVDTSLGQTVYTDFDKLLTCCDAVYIASSPKQRYEQVKKALDMGKHVLCKSPIALSKEKCKELFNLAASNHLILMDALKTAYAMAFNRLILLARGGKIGRILSIDATCTSLNESEKENGRKWNSICTWGPVAMLPIFQLLGASYIEKQITSFFTKDNYDYDIFTKIDFLYPQAVASIKVGRGFKSEGELIIGGTKGYIYVPAPWWKTDYYELRFEHSENNKRYFYQLDGEGIRYEIVAFLKSIMTGKNNTYVEEYVSEGIAGVISDFYNRRDIKIILSNE